MKTMTKIALTVLALAMLLSMAVFADNAPTLSIEKCNLSLRDNVCIKYAVTTNSSAKTTLLVWDAPQTEYTYGTQTKEIESKETQTISGKTYKVYDYCDIAAKDMPKAVYARVYTKIGDAEYYSDVVKYSILKYAYNKLGKTGTATTDANLKQVILDMLEYGASAQIYLNHNTDRLATADFYEVKTVGGTIDDLCNYGLYLTGDKVKLVAPLESSDGIPFSGWVDDNGSTASSSAVCEVTVGTGNVTYTATYKRVSQGLEIESNDDGTCCLVSIGDCTDTDIIIPATYNGDVVTSIDSNAFSGEAITSITIPATIVEIGRRAFNNCDDLTDVYYEGSEEEWNEIDINGTGNSALTGANIHFAKVTKYTVTFVDYNGTILSEQSVEKGKAATAPADPARAGYTFIGWDKSFDNITGALTVTAQYEENTVSYDEPTFVVGNVTANAGDTVELTIDIAENPGILGMVFSVSFDDTALTLTGCENGAALSKLTLQKPSKYESGSNYVWYASETGEIMDGSVLTLTFKVSDTASGTYPITLTYDDGSIYNASYDTVSPAIVNGSITVE